MKKRLPRLEVSPGALLLFALLVYFSEPGRTGAVLVPVGIHELGHLAAMGLYRIPVQSLRLELSGLRIDCAAGSTLAEEVALALAGPTAGLLCAAAAEWLGRALGSETVRLSGGVSLLLSLFNLLPVQPLDGGRIFSALAEAWAGADGGGRLARTVSILGAAAVALTGLALALCGRGKALALSGLFLLAAQLPPGDTGLKKPGR